VAFSIDGYLGSSVPALKVGADRTELIARNLANTDTPNYKARDIDFRSALATAGSPGSSLALTATQPMHISTDSASAADPMDRNDLKYRVPLAPALDGNTVDPQLEQASFAETTVRFQSSLTFLGAKFKNLMTAITGQ